MKWTREEHIVRYNLFGSLALLLILAFLLFALSFSFEHRYHTQELEQIVKKLLDREKELLQASVNEYIAHLITRKEQGTLKLKKTLQQRVHNASRIAKHLYNKGQSQGLEREEIAARIREAIRPLRFNKQQSYFFIRSLDGISQLYPPNPAQEGKDMRENSTENRMRVLQQMVDTVTTIGEGFVEYEWPKPSQDKNTLYKKISYLTYFEPLDWYIGCGEYVADFEEHIKMQILTVMNNPGWSADSNHHIFILDLHDINGAEHYTTMRVNPNRPNLVGKVIPDSFRDADDKEFVKEYLQSLREKDGAFVTYRFKKPSSDTPQLKMSYVKLIPEWNWIIGQSIHLVDTERFVSMGKVTGMSLVKKEGTYFLFLFALALALCSSLVIALFFSRRLKAIFADYRASKDQLQGELQQQYDNLEGQVIKRTRELERANEQLIHAEKISAIGRLSASIAHELNNPLNGIRSVMEGLQLNTSQAPEDSKLIDLALKECDRVKKLIRQLLDFSSPSAGTRSAVDSKVLINEVLAMTEKELLNCGISVERVFAEQLPILHTIPDQFKQVLLNLITNAKDAMRDGGGILHIQTGQFDQGLVIHIRDGGTGISPENLGQIFEPFFTTKSTVKGTGLGLSVSYGIVKNLGGRLEVESVLGEGTTFTLYIPVRDE